MFELGYLLWRFLIGSIIGTPGVAEFGFNDDRNTPPMSEQVKKFPK